MKKNTLFLICAAVLLLQIPSHDEDLWSASLTKSRTIAGVLEKSYFKPLEEEDLAVAAIKGTLDTLDPHSYFLDPSSFSRMREDYTGKYYGTGMQIQKQGEAIVVIAPIEGGPAHRLGILPGDIISHIDGESTVPISSYDAMQKLRGTEKGTKVTVTFVREGGEAVRPDHRPRGDPAPERPLLLPPRRRHRLHLHPELRRRDAARARGRAGQADRRRDEEPHPRPAPEHRRGPGPVRRDLGPLPAAGVAHRLHERPQLEPTTGSSRPT